MPVAPEDDFSPAVETRTRTVPAGGARATTIGAALLAALGLYWLIAPVYFPNGQGFMGYCGRAITGPPAFASGFCNGYWATNLYKAIAALLIAGLLFALGRRYYGTETIVEVRELDLD